MTRRRRRKVEDAAEDVDPVIRTPAYRRAAAIAKYETGTHVIIHAEDCHEVIGIGDCDCEVVDLVVGEKLQA